MVILTVNPALLSTTMLVLINVNTSLHNELSISGVGTMGTGGYIVPCTQVQDLYGCTPCTPKSKMRLMSNF